MAQTTRQTSIFGVEDWKKIYQTFSDADLQSYDFETLRKSFIDYIKLNYPESFNDFVESSEYISMLDLIAFMGQSLSYRVDLNARENFIDTAERRDSVVRLAKLVGYTPKRNTASTGYVKIDSISTSETVIDSNGDNISNTVITWNDLSNVNWRDQFNAILNASLVNSQKIGKPGNKSKILDSQISEYTVDITPGQLPVFAFDTVVDGTTMNFELTSASSVNKDYLYEPSPRPDGSFNILYKVDGLGYASSHTGFFVRFRQGSLLTQDYTLAERLPNRTVSIATDSINDEDVWLFEVDANNNIGAEWEKVDNVQSGKITVNVTDRKLFSVSSRANDQADLVFGDGIFSAIPVNTMRAYYRVSNGLAYTINTEEMQTIQVPISYTSRSGRTETLTITVSLTEPVNNSLPRESIADIKSRAPQRFYTQNRMVNGEDYNIFPYTLYSSILKSKAVNRSSIGISRSLDLVDATSRYSSTNMFGSDGVIYRDTISPSFSFSFVDINDVSSIIINQVEPMLRARSLLHFYYAEPTNRTFITEDLTWHSSSISTNSSTGYFSKNNNPQPIGDYVSNSRKFIKKGALIKFSAPVGTYFNARNTIVTGIPLTESDKTYIWSTITSVELDGTNYGLGNLDSGKGPVTLNNVVPDGAEITTILPGFTTNLQVATEILIKEQILIYKDFGIRYDNQKGQWKIVTSNNMDYANAYSTQFAGDNSNVGLDASWLVKFTSNGSKYTVTSRGLNYFFASEKETRFFYDATSNIYDPKTGSVVNDYINILKTNAKAQQDTALNTDINLDIIGQTVEADGYVNDSQVLVSFTDIDADAIPDDPDFYDLIVAPNTSPELKYVYLERITSNDNLTKLLAVPSGFINDVYATKTEIIDHQYEYNNNTTFYAYTDNKFYNLQINVIGEIILTEVNNYVAKVGRQDLYFQYRHNSPNSRRVDPGTTNIIELFLVTHKYYTAFRQWIQDGTNAVTKPLPPTIDELEIEYSKLNKYKMVSDTLVLNSVVFKPLFGAKADPALQASIRVVKLDSAIISNSEIQSKVVAKMNQYFSLDNWDFGNTFYFSELASYLHSQLGSIIGSVVIVPRSPLLNFGTLFEIKSQPNEIFINAAIVDDIDVVTTLSATTLNTTTNIVI